MEAIDFVALAKRKVAGLAPVVPAPAPATPFALTHVPETTPAPAPAPAPATSAATEPAAAADTEEGNAHNVRETLIYTFANMLSQFLDAALYVWDKSAQLQAWKTAFDGRVAGAQSDAERHAFYKSLIEQFHGLFKSDYADIAAENPRFLDKEATNEWMRVIHVKAKFMDAPPSIKAKCWEYMRMLCRTANLYALYASCPDGLLRQIHKLAVRLGGKVQRGELTLEKLDFPALLKELTGVLSTEDVQKFSANFLSENNLPGVLAMVRGMISSYGLGNVFDENLASFIKSATGGSGDVSLESMLSGAGLAGAGAGADAGAGAGQ